MQNVAILGTFCVFANEDNCGRDIEAILGTISSSQAITIILV